MSAVAEFPRTPVQTLSAELEHARTLLRASVKLQRKWEQQAQYHRERHEYFRRLCLGYERELKVRK